MKVIKNKDLLLQKKCIPCEGGTKPFDKRQIASYIKELSLRWEVVYGKKIKHEFKFNNFTDAMDFVNRIADLAEEEGHHPDIHVYYNKVNIVLSTHAIGGLSENDFIIAAKIERLAS